jgi:hypothetical protein
MTSQMKIYFSIILFCLPVMSCHTDKPKSQDMPVARVFDRYLYTSDLREAIPSGLNQIDSLALVKDFIDKWVRKQLLLKKADENLTPQEKNVEKQIEDYRLSLLVFKYEQSLIQQKLDTNITQKEIEDYYNQNSSNFILNENLVKAVYIKVPKTAPDLWKLRRWYKSDNESDVKNLEAYCYQYAEKYDYFNEDWVQFKLLLEQLPEISSSPQNILTSRNSLELSDTSSIYLVRIMDYKLEGTVAPVEFVNSNIKSIVLNKRKIQYINHSESEIYNYALNHGNFTIY